MTSTFHVKISTSSGVGNPCCYFWMRQHASDSFCSHLVSLVFEECFQLGSKWERGLNKYWKTDQKSGHAPEKRYSTHTDSSEPKGSHADGPTKETGVKFKVTRKAFLHHHDHHRAEKRWMSGNQTETQVNKILFSSPSDMHRTDSFPY